MLSTNETDKRLYLSALSITAWAAVVLQLYLILVHRVASVPETLLRFFSFFTILTNILVALCCTLVLLKPGSGWGAFFARPQTLTAITLYIAVVGFIYNTILRMLWSPQGLQFVVDELLHSVVPVLFILFWFFFVPKNSLHWKGIFPWLLYPALYCIFILARGAVSGFYPYPFVNVIELGYGRVLLNAAGIVVVFLLTALVLTGAAKILGKIARKTN